MPHLRESFSVKRPRMSLSSLESDSEYRIHPERKSWQTPLRSTAKYVGYFLIVFITISFLNGLCRPSYSSPPAHYNALRTTIESSTEPGRGNPNKEQIFIASNIINADLIRNQWGPTLVELVDILGPDNVFVSIYENDSGEEPPKALRELRDHLTCESSFVIGDHLPLTSFPNVTTPDGVIRTKRLTYLTEVRNRLLLPLDPPSTTDSWAHKHPLFRSAHARKFDRVLFLNDVYFSPVEAAQLLFSTNYNAETERADYDVACAVDFTGSFNMYDSFVVRSSNSYGMGGPMYPFFRPYTDSRNDVLSQTDAVRVRSCWNGMASFSASHFLPISIPSPIPMSISTSPPSDSLVGSLKTIIHASDSPSHVTVPAVRFRSSPEPFWEESECCLIFADIEVRSSLLSSAPFASGVLSPPALPVARGVYLNPYIRVAYTPSTWAGRASVRRWERSWQFFQYWLSFVNPDWNEKNPRRTETPGQIVQRRVWVADEHEGKYGRWEQRRVRATPGAWCGQRRGFFMLADVEKENRSGTGKNWVKIRVP